MPEYHKSSLNTDLDNVKLQCFTPEPDFVEVSSGSAVDVNKYSVICFDQEADIFFNGNNDIIYKEWPANFPLQINKRVQSITFSVDGTLQHMDQFPQESEPPT